MNNIISISRLNYKVYLISDLDIFDKIFNILYPYYTIEKEESINNDLWKIYINEVTLKDFEIITSEMNALSEPLKKFKVSKSERVISICEPFNMEWKIQQAVRFIRDIFRNYLNYRNMLFFHGGLVYDKINNVGISIMGEKMSGKTSTILSWLNKSSYYVTNDDISVKKEGTNIMGYGWPRAVSVRNDTFDMLEMDKVSIVKNLTHPSNKTKLKKSATFLYPYELANVTNSMIKDECRINYIIFPKFDDAITDPQITRLSKSEFKQNLLTNIEPDINKHFKEFEKFFLFSSIQSSPVIDEILEKTIGLELRQNFFYIKKTPHYIRGYIEKYGK
ncbi:hypothetical protein GZH82_00220 [Staphylococcus ursi]|uniref:hypothetical protein n=1 Tax=Staphylococcus sp. MI 10-1553 TaxID=1912064 RepID=UPI001397EE44|nr:hypothetical protein [Staphylococcus sp. MI 10-1553]QHW35918.1 hypothetical protein GZH82_00220 [Staphylococcus sp. MI 10-1553]